MEEQKQTASKIIAAFCKAEPELSHTALADVILEEHPDIGFAHRTLRMKISQYRSADDEIEVKTEKPQEKYWVNDEIYHISSKYGVFKMPVRTIDKIFLHYSKHGYNLTGDEIQAKFDLKPHEWVALKNHLNLYKTSNIYSPHTRDTTPKEDLDALIDNELEKLFRNKGIVEKKYNQVLHREYKRVIEKSNFREMELRHLVTEIYESLDIINGEKYIIPLVRVNEKSEVVITIADIHFGAVYNNGKNHNYTMFAVEQAMMHIADVINREGYSKVHVLFLGDLIHNFKEMHKGMWQETDVKEGIGGKLVVNTVHLLAKFASRVNNLAGMHFVEGNHDRTTEKSDRISNELTTMITAWLDEMVTVPVEFHGDVGVIEVEDINYVFAHGDRVVDNKDVYRILNRVGVHNRKFSMVMKAHKHSRMHGHGGSRGSGTGDDNYDCRFVHVPSIFTLDTYTNSLGFHALAGFTATEAFEKTVNGMTMPKVIDYPLDVTSWNL